MGSLRRRLGLLEREAGQHHEVLVLPGGAKLHYSPEEAATAFAAVKGDAEHWLIEPFVSAETATGMPGLVRSLVLSHELVEERGGGTHEGVAATP